MHGTWKYRCEVDGCGVQEERFIPRRDRDLQTCSGHNDWEHPPCYMTRVLSPVATTFRFADPRSHKKSRK